MTKIQRDVTLGVLQTVQIMYSRMKVRKWISRIYTVIVNKYVYEIRNPNT